ncbi:MAG: hypothetical protein FWF68_06335, partial [Spirochaetes bacterium]|nr:hypothetical protein [Spirochaetota bacterium]
TTDNRQQTTDNNCTHLLNNNVNYTVVYFLPILFSFTCFYSVIFGNTLLRQKVMFINDILTILLLTAHKNNLYVKYEIGNPLPDCEKNQRRNKRAGV